MTEAVLQPSELEQLLTLLSASSPTLQQTEANFRSTFKPEQFGRIIAALQFLRRDALVVGAYSHVETVNALFLLDLLRRSCSGDELSLAKAALYDLLLQLEQLLRDDARKLESSKYRATTKEGAQQVSKRSAKDVVDNEAMRGRSAAKLFAFQCLSGRVDLSQTVASIVAQDAATVDSALDAWQKAPSEIKESLNDIAHAAEVENEKNSIGVLAKQGVLLYPAAAASGNNQGSAAQFMSPTPVRVPIVQAGTAVNDLKFLLNQSPSLSQQFLFDSQWHSASWRTAVELVQVASSAKLTPQQQADAVSSMNSNTVPRLGLTTPLMCAIVQHNPEIAAAILSKLKDPSQLLEGVLSSSAPADHIETVMLHCVQCLRQIHVYKYVASSVARFRSLTAGSQASKEAVMNLANTLHQLITKYSKDNKELYLNDSQKGELGRLFEEHGAGLPEVSSRWADLK